MCEMCQDEKAILQKNLLYHLFNGGNGDNIEFNFTGCVKKVYRIVNVNIQICHMLTSDN